MSHDWVFDVLSDLLDYAKQNGLNRLAAKVSEAIDTAQQELHAPDAGPEAPSRPSPSKGRPMH
ncbi:MAG: hypothetical protein ACK4TJ_17715 [Tabrizicola sp.]